METPTEHMRDTSETLANVTLELSCSVALCLGAEFCQIQSHIYLGQNTPIELAILYSLLLITRQSAQLICLGCKIIQSAVQLHNYS